jgi:hypothetical protein
MHKFIAHDRSQQEYTIEPHIIISQYDISSLMHDDTFCIKDDKIVIIDSLKSKPICGILKMDKKMAKQKNKYLYKCIPDNNLLPIVLIPIKDDIDFYKHKCNRYVTFMYVTNDIGQLYQTIGPVTDLPSFNEYQLTVKNLNISSKKFTQKVRNINHTIDNCIIDNAITIDSSSTQDYDDAISFNNNCISVHISNVPMYMEAHDLWNYINKVSTIYLPDKKRSMLPTILTDDILSLKANVNREVFSMNILFEENEIKEINFSKEIIKIKKNHIYESEELLNDNVYMNIKEKIPILILKYPYLSNINNSYEVVEYLMIFMNAQSAIKLQSHNVGIYRSLILEGSTESNIVDPIMRKFISYWRNSKSEYTTSIDHEHQLLMLKDYVHITSPIRRLVDIVNMMILQHVLNIYTFDHNALSFYNHHINDLPNINKTVKDIKRIQNDCEILGKYWSDNDVTAINTGYVIEILDNNEYCIFINNTKYVGKLFSDKKLYLYDKINIQIFLFIDKSSLKQKVQLSILNI